MDSERAARGTPPPRALAPPERLWPLLAAGFLLGAAVLVFSKTMQRSLDHDEHQFVASAAIHARDGLLPYRDFPHFHMPYQVFVYGLLFQLGDRLLLAARGLAVVCAWVTLLLVLLGSRRVLRPLGPWWGPLLALALGVLLLFNPLFVYTTGIAWNHDIAIALALAAFIAQAGALDREVPATRRLVLAGVLLGLSAGMRLTTLPLAAAHVLVLWWPRRSTSMAATVRFGSGLALGLAPALALFATAPGEAWFGNLEYAGLNTEYRRQTDFDVAMTWPDKGRYLLTEVLDEPANAALLVLCLAALVLRPRRSRVVGPQRFVLLAMPFALLGSLAPTPSWYQYYYALVPLAVVGLGYVLGDLAAAPARRTLLGGAVVLTAALGVATTLSSYRTLSNLRDPGDWTPSEVHAVGRTIDELAPPGPILTVSPIFPLEGGRPVYPALASGPFALRTAGLMPPEERRRRGMVAPDDLDELVGPDGPAAVFTGHDRKADPLLDEWATRRGFTPVELEGGERLYLRGAADG